MLNYNEMVIAEQKYIHENNKMLISLYKETIDYIKKVINLAFDDNSANIASYLLNIPNNTMILEWPVENSNYIGVTIKYSGKSIDVILFEAHSFSDASLTLALEANDEEILNFFKKEYNYFQILFKPKYSKKEYIEQECVELKDKCIIYKIIKKFNKVLYKEFGINFKNLHIQNLEEFENSKYALRLSDERIVELEKTVFDYYDNLSKKRDNLIKEFEEIVKDLR